MPAGSFQINQCDQLGYMTGASGSYTANVASQGFVEDFSTAASTNCAGESGSTTQCSLWTVEMHTDATGTAWWPLANGIPINYFK